MPLGSFLAVSVLSSNLYSSQVWSSQEHHFQAALSVVPSKVIRQPLPQFTLKNGSESFRKMIHVLGVARESPRGSGSENVDAVTRRHCSSAVDPALHEERKSLPRDEKGDIQPPAYGAGTTEAVKRGRRSSQEFGCAAFLW
jgi:hypothetical protein